MGKTEGKRCAPNQKETEEQSPKRDYRRALLTDMIRGLKRWRPQKVSEESMPFGDYDTWTVY